MQRAIVSHKMMHFQQALALAISEKNKNKKISGCTYTASIQTGAISSCFHETESLVSLQRFYELKVGTPVLEANWNSLTETVSEMNNKESSNKFSFHAICFISTSGY